MNEELREALKDIVKSQMILEKVVTPLGTEEMLPTLAEAITYLELAKVRLAREIKKGET